MKICYKCKIQDKINKNGLCKECNKLSSRQYRNKNKDKVKKYQQEYDKNYYQENKIEILKYKKEYYNKKLNKTLVNDKKIKRNIYCKNKRKKDLNFRLRSNISASINCMLKNNNSSKQNKSCLKYLDFSILQLKNYLEGKFESWMNWNNYGKFLPERWKDNDQSTWTWNIDHIIPHSKFKYTSMNDQDFKKCWSLDNLRPYSAKQNWLDGIYRTRH